jgi:hypothetical protein
MAQPVNTKLLQIAPSGLWKLTTHHRPKLNLGL